MSPFKSPFHSVSISHPRSRLHRLPAHQLSYAPSKMYYNHDDPYAPRTGLAAMPSPRLEYAPYYSGCDDSFEDFLEEFKGQAYDCTLTDPQRVDVVIRYVDPSMHNFWRSLNGFCSHDWPLFQRSLINVFSSTTPRPQDETEVVQLRPRLFQDTNGLCRRRVGVLRQFICYGVPLVHTGHLSEEECDLAFWFGFHLEDREVPFHFGDVFGCVRGAFAYGDSFSSWSSEYQFEPPSARCEQLVAEHVSRDLQSPRSDARCRLERRDHPLQASLTLGVDVRHPPPLFAFALGFGALARTSAFCDRRSVRAHVDVLDFPYPAVNTPACTLTH